MAFEELGGEAEFAAEFAHLILVELGEGFDDAVFVDELLDAGDAVVVGLDEVGFGGAAGLDGIGVDGALAEDPVAVEVGAGLEDLLLNLDELFADDATLVFGFGDAFEGGEEVELGVDDAEVFGAEGGEDFADEGGFLFAHEAGVDVGAVDALVAEGF